MFNIEKNYKQNDLLKVWFIYKNIIIQLLYKTMGGLIKKIKLVSSFDVELEVSGKNTFPLMVFLKNHSLCLFTSLIDIICYDVPNKTHRFSLVYNLLSIKFNSRIRIISKIQENYNQILSMISLYRSAGWSEREVFDFYGLFFFENLDLRRILNDYGFKGFPLRKDFPLTGYIEVYYNDNKKKICYKNLELGQEYRAFSFKTNWSYTKGNQIQ
jgi:NADH dehydrogenase (ubiquinone) Fe-S protein 3